MTPPEIPDRKQWQRLHIPPWLSAFITLLVYGLGPWALSLLSIRHGWSAARPGIVNLLGLIPVAAGAAGLFWIQRLHFTQPPGVKLALSQDYLLTQGPYAFTRHPMYLSELVILLGWSLFYGSIPVLIAFFFAILLFNAVNLPLEERALETRFGEAYRQYKSLVPRWLGIPRTRV